MVWGFFHLKLASCGCMMATAIFKHVFKCARYFFSFIVVPVVVQRAGRCSTAESQDARMSKVPAVAFLVYICICRCLQGAQQKGIKIFCILFLPEH